MLQKEILKFPLLLWHEGEEGYQKVSNLIENHLEVLQNKIDQYVPSLSIQMYDWVRDPFSASSAQLENFTLKGEEEFCELQPVHTLKMRFTDLPMEKFWISGKEEYPAVHRKALNILLQFSNSYMCEQAFPYLTSIKSKDRNRLISAEDEIRVSLSQAQPRIEYCAGKKKHGFHIKEFPETYIGDSEEVCRKNPSGKKHLMPQRDIKSASLLSFDNVSHDSDNLVDSGELKEQLASEGVPHNEEVYVGKEKETEQMPSSYQKEEHEGNQQQQKPQYTNLLDFRWLQEKEEEEAAHQDDSSSVLEDLSSQGVFMKHSACDAQEGLWPPPGDNTEEHLEPRVNEVSLIDSFESDGKLLPNASLPKSSCPESSPVDHEGYYLCDEEALLKESSASTGYYPCYRTYVEFPRYQPPNTSNHSEGKGSPCDACVQCDGCLQEEATGREKRGVEANNNLKELKVSVALCDSPHGQPSGSSRPGSGGRKLEGPGGRRSRPPINSGQESGGTRKEQEGTPKPRTPGNSPAKSSARLSNSKEPPASGPRNSLLLPTANMSRKSPQKRKHRSGQADEKEQATLMELKPLLHDQRSLPPSPEEKTGALRPCCYGTEAAGENCQVRPATDRKNPSPRQLPSAKSSAIATEPPRSPAEPHTTSSHLSFHTIVSWVWRIFKKPPPAQPQPSTSSETEIGGSSQSLAARLRLWLTLRHSRIHPRPP